MMDSSALTVWTLVLAIAMASTLESSPLGTMAGDCQLRVLRVGPSEHAKAAHMDTGRQVQEVGWADRDMSRIQSLLCGTALAGVNKEPPDHPLSVLQIGTKSITHGYHL